MAASEQPLPRGPQLRTYRLRFADQRRRRRLLRLGAVQPGASGHRPRPRARGLALSIGCRAQGPRPPRPISAEQRLLETFFPGPGRGGAATRRP